MSKPSHVVKFGCVCAVKSLSKVTLIDFVWLVRDVEVRADEGLICCSLDLGSHGWLTLMLETRSILVVPSSASCPEQRIRPRLHSISMVSEVFLSVAMQSISIISSFEVALIIWTSMCLPSINVTCLSSFDAQLWSIKLAFKFEKDPWSRTLRRFTFSSLAIAIEQKPLPRVSGA